MPPHLRVTDSDRERVAPTLRVTAGEGALSVEELDERLSATYAAVTRADPVHLVSDLSSLPGAAPAVAPAARLGQAIRARSGSSTRSCLDGAARFERRRAAHPAHR